MEQQLEQIRINKRNHGINFLVVGKNGMAWLWNF